jgi:hypothetical protein
MSARRSLDVLEIKTPCPADWDAMTGDAQTRFCAHCQKHVHDLSQMPRDQAERLVCESAGNLCVRFARDEAGQVITLDYRRQKQQRWPWRLWTLVALCLAMITGTVEAVFFGKKIQAVTPSTAPAQGQVMVLGAIPPPNPLPVPPPTKMGEVAPCTK